MTFSPVNCAIERHLKQRAEARRQITFRRGLLSCIALVVMALAFAGLTSSAEANNERAIGALKTWYKLSLSLVRHTATYSPPVASRAFAYTGVTAFEAIASGSSELISLAGQLNGLSPIPARAPGLVYDDAVVLNAALSFLIKDLFANTGPTGQRVIGALDRKLAGEVGLGVPPDVAARSQVYGEAIADHILAWSRADGAAVIENLGFPVEYALASGPGRWVPTSKIALQQAPLLPNWGKQRPFAMPDGGACPLPPPPAYSEDKSSAFFREALEVYETHKALDAERKAIARFWSDDPMLSPTPPGHWISIALQVLDSQKPDLARYVDALARIGVTVADAFIGCWHSKFEYDLLRPVTYIKRLIDPAWEPLLITPPFPEYPSGHSTQSGAAATVLSAVFGDAVAFEDRTHDRDGLPARRYPSFWAAAEEAALSRLYGGIHFRAAIERGLEQGRCIGAFTNAIKTRRS